MLRLSLFATSLLCSSLTAAPIDWGQATNVSTGAGNSADVSINGTLIEAYNAVANDQLASTAAIVVNGVTFTPTTSLLNADPRNGGGNDFSSDTNSGDSNYDNLLSTLEYGGGTDLVTLTLGDGDGDASTNGAGLLTVGSDYEIQIWYVDTRGGTDGRAVPVGDEAGNKVSLNDQFVIGTFTADATTQNITLESPGFGQAHINAYQIRAIVLGPPPAPVTPTNLTINPGNNLLFLDWDDYGQSGLLEFRIRRATSIEGPYTQIGTSTLSRYNDTTAVNGTTYYYTITSVNTDNLESSPSTPEEGLPAQVAEPHNFLFIIADDMDTYALNAYRQSEPAENDSENNPYPIDTPNLDRLAAEGMIFHQARFMGSWIGAVCTGTRTSIMTGRNAWSSRTDLNGAGRASNSFPGVFNTGTRSGLSPRPHATYRTCKNGNSYNIANNEFTTRNDATRRGNSPGSGSEWHADRSLDHIEDWRTTHRPLGKPFLMYLGFSHPHDERNTQNSLTNRYGCLNTTSPASVVLNPAAPPLPLNHLPVLAADGIPANYPFHPFDHGHLNVRDELLAPGILGYRNEEVTRNEIGRNFACVDWIDQQLGRVFDKLEDPNGDGDPSDSILDNTYIVFTSDHGIAIGRHGLQGKQNLYEHSWRVPYIVRGPGIAAGSHSDALIYLHDSFPTFCDLAGLELPITIDENDGKSFRSVLEGTSQSHREHLYGLYSGGSKPGIRAITDGRFKLIKYDVDNNATQVTQLFDLESNPFELLPEHGTPNLANETAYAGIRLALEEQLASQRIENADPDEFLGDRTLLRFENDSLNDRLPFQNNATALSGNGGNPPIFSSEVAHPTDYLFGEPNNSSLEFKAEDQTYLQLTNDSSLSFGNHPFTIEAWVKLAVLPTTNDIASTAPIVMKKVIGSVDGELDYMFLAAAGQYGNATTFNRLALHLGSGVVTSTLAIPDTDWHCVSVALDPVSNTVRFTLDDLTDTQTTALNGTRNNGPVIIGAHFNSNESIDATFSGLIDEISITDGFLSPSEIQPLKQVAPVTDFKIISLEYGADQSSIDLTFQSDPTRLYHIQWSQTLQSPDWTDIRTFVPGRSAASKTTVTDLPFNPSRGFFRVRTSL